MSLKFEKLDGNMAKLTIEVEAAEFDKAIEKAYHKIKNQLQIPGFRKGKVPQKMAEKVYGVEIFYEDAANFVINDTYPVEAKQVEEEIVSSPELDIEQIEKGKNFIYTAVVAIRPEVTLGEYKGLEYTEFSAEVSDEEVQTELERTQKQNGRKVPVEDRPAQDGDEVSIDFDGYVNGRQFDGGKAEGYTLVLGSHSFIDTFEDQVIGHNPGDEFDVNVTFPDVYQSKELEGKPAVFKCRLNEIKKEVLPEIDDEFAAEVSEFDTLDEYKEDVRAQLLKKKTESAKNTAKDEIIEKAVANAQMDIPDVMVEEQARSIARNIQMNMQQYGIAFDQYLEMMGQTEAQFLNAQKPSALKSIKSRLVLEAIAKAEGLEATEEDIEEQYSEMAEAYQMAVEKIKEAISDEEKEDLKADIAATKASDFLLSNGKAVPKKEEAAEAPEEEAPSEPAEEAAEE